MPKSMKSQTDWEQVKRNIDTGAAIPYRPEDGPYDPNDDEAVERYLRESIVLYHGRPIERNKPDRDIKHR